MKKRVLVGVLASLLLLSMLAAGCGSSTKTTPTTTPKEVGNVTGESITAIAGQDFQVALSENPSTGFMWTITTTPDSKVVVQKGKSTFVQAPGSSAVAGAGGTEGWTFTAVAAGNTSIGFENKQAGAPASEPPAWSHTVAVKVTPPPATPPPAPKTYTDPKTPINETVGREFHINLSEQTASTGYKWLLNSGYNHSVCAFQGVKFINVSGQSGAASTEVWRFLTKGKGTTKLTFNYVQPFNQSGTPAKTVTFTVNVK
ncbi:MAG: protease inhibitor I42 family protein [Candidatus Geothermincolia bacterium]